MGEGGAERADGIIMARDEDAPQGNARAKLVRGGGRPVSDRGTIGAVGQGAADGAAGAHPVDQVAAEHRQRRSRGDNRCGQTAAAAARVTAPPAAGATAVGTGFRRRAHPHGGRASTRVALALGRRGFGRHSSLARVARWETWSGPPRTQCDVAPPSERGTNRLFVPMQGAVHGRVSTR